MTTTTASPQLIRSEDKAGTHVSGDERTPLTQSVEPRNAPVVISLFCGCGGFDLGFEKAGFSVPLAYDANATVVDTYNHNRRRHEDGVLPSIARIADLMVKTGAEIIEDFEELGLNQAPSGVVGGAPCQTFSFGNNHFKAEDPKHRLPIHYAEILSTLNERYQLDFFIFENVLGIKSRKHKETFAQFKALFDRAGFHLFEGELDAKNFGVAQKRPRVFVVGLNKTKFPTAKFVFPAAQTPDGCISQRKVKDVLVEQVLGEPQFWLRTLKPEAVRAATGHPNHWAMNPKSPKFFDGTLENGKIRGRSFRRVEWEDFSDAVAYGHNEVHIHPSGKRRLSVLEAMLLQGFPHTYQLQGSLSQQISQISDAIPPQLGHALGCALSKFFETVNNQEEMPQNDAASP
jgi:DNA (cytosine-5)-methyltransferase 1